MGSIPPDVGQIMHKERQLKSFKYQSAKLQETMKNLKVAESDSLAYVEELLK